MSKFKILWVIRSERGQVRGPFDTPMVLSMIRDGRITGEEAIAKYPGGNWLPISKEPEFYDHLLGALQLNPDELPSPPNDEATVPRKAPQNAETVITQNAKSVELTRTFAKPLPARAKTSPPVIELSNLKKIENKKRAQVAWKPMVGFAAVVVGAMLFLLWPTRASSGKIHLLAPKKGEELFSADEVKLRTRKALADIQKDTVESYMEAQNKLVTLIEGSPRNLPARALLCVVYKELWPYSYQDPADEKTLTEFSQGTKNLNVIGIHGNICEAVKLMTLGRTREARGVVDGMLDNPDDVSFLSIVYVIKGELLTFDHDSVNAIAFFKQASEKGRDWLKPQSALATLYLNTRQYGLALEAFNGILKANPAHKVATLGMGLTLYKGYGKTDEAFLWLKSAFDMPVKAPRETEADAYYILAKLAVKKDDKALAKQAIARAFDRNPQNEAIKDLFFQLGGTDKANTGSQKNELMFLGEQYARQGDCFSAQAQFKTAFELDPKNGTAAMKAAKCLWALHQSFEAIEWLRKAIQADPALISAYVLQADYMSQRYDFSGATQILLSAKSVSPSSYEVQRGFAQIEFRKNNLEGAAAYGLKALNIYQGDVDTLVILSQSNLYLAQRMLPNNPKEAKRRDEALKDAMKYALKAIEIDGTNVEVNKNYAVVMSLTMGLDAGVRILQEMIKKYSFNYEYRVALADLLRTEQRFTEAAKIYTQVVDVDPKNKEAFIGLGDCYKAQKEVQKSLKAFLSASAIDPTDAQPIFEIGRLFLETQRYDESVKYFDRVAKINPNYPRMYYFRGKAAFMGGAIPMALESAKMEKRNNPSISDSYILTAEIQHAMKQYGECASEYSQAIKLRPQPAEVYVRAAQCYRLAGSTEVAEDMLAMASQRESGFAEIYREQGAIFDTKGDRKASVKAYCLYVELSPNAPDKKEIEGRLNRLGFRLQDCNNN